ncbi:hypothetical protein DFH07DRAFT_782754 [Mycena maculata]|uniref:Uncharacterized protein n=1 Tax=Mycena maculata TaxID=230809 RepID=A0AAD7HSE4_9AGAR|nr:hypothetical protein DFH07DRAFT_782754 [Mycena maculata]
MTSATGTCGGSGRTRRRIAPTPSPFTFSLPALVSDGMTQLVRDEAPVERPYRDREVHARRREERHAREERDPARAHTLHRAPAGRGAARAPAGARARRRARGRSGGKRRAGKAKRAVMRARRVAKRVREGSIAVDAPEGWFLLREYMLARGASSSGVPPSKTLTLSDVYGLVKSMEARMTAQEAKLQALEEEILVLKRDNSELWQEIHRLKGPRFPFEIFSLIILSTGDKKALTMFSLVSHGWMSVTRRILFKLIDYSAMFLGRIPLVPLLNNEHCTIFPYVQTIAIIGGTDDGSDPTDPEWMDDFLRVIPKFVALRSLEVYELGAWGFQKIQLSMPQSIKNNIKEVTIDMAGFHMSEFAASVSMFTSLETFTSLNGYSEDETSELPRGLVPPPSSIRELLFRSSEPNDLVVLKWFADLHSGIIESIDPYNLPFQRPVEFRRLLTRFGSTLSKIKFIISDDEDAGQFLDSGYCAALPQLKSITLIFESQTVLWTIEWLPKILALLPTSIEEVILFLTIDPPPSEHAVPEHKLHTINWSRLDQSLTGLQYPSLHILKIRMSAEFYPFTTAEELKQVMEWWLKLLPICARKGILETHIE